MKNLKDLQTETLDNLTQRKKKSREYLRSRSPEEKIAGLIQLQEQYYQMLKIREDSGGRSIPAKWRKWYKARYE